MAKRLAIDWDDTELRLVAAQTSASGIRITDAAVIPIEDGKVLQALQDAVASRGLEKTETMVAIGRGKAELRELKLPPVPDNELPDMVRFQSIRTFASAGDAATVDYLVTKRSDEGIEMIAAAIGPAKLESVRDTCEKAGLTLRRAALRPLTAAALYLSQHAGESGETVLIDLLASDAEIVIARDGKVVFVRTVRLPNAAATRPAALAGELRRSLLACGTDNASRRVFLWGRQAVHADDIAMLSEATGTTVTTLDPFRMVDISDKVTAELPEHVGRLAPLVGLLSCDESDADRLIDFLNPRKRIEKVTDHRKTAALVGAPIALVALVGWLIYSQLSDRTRQIELLVAENASLKPQVEIANKSVDRTERIDQFLDGDVNWLKELTRVADAIPPAEELILSSISAGSSGRGLGAARGASGTAGSATLKLEGFVTEADVIDRLEESLRGEQYRVIGRGTNKVETRDAYRWTFDETVYIDPASVRQARYEGIASAMEEPVASDEDSDQTPPQTDQDPGDDDDTPAEPQPTEAEPAEDSPGENNAPSESAPADDDQPLLETSIPETATPLAAGDRREVSQ